jgi:hypothetical protein
VNEVPQVVPALANKEIWIIDDSLPVEQLEFDKDDFLQGLRPIDRGTLRELMKKDWDEIAVEDLCNELLSTALNVTAFIQPSSAVNHLLRGASIPDAVIFDLKYRTANDEQVRTSLRSLLTSSISIVQVYTKDSLDAARDELASLLSDFPTRLVEPTSKDDTNAEALAKAIKQQVDKSLSAKLAKELRRLSLQAVESVLVRIDGLPQSGLKQLLGGAADDDAEESELTELLSTKVSETLAGAAELTEAIETYVSESGIIDERKEEVVRRLADVVVATAREAIRNSGGLLALAENWERAQLANVPNPNNTGQIIREFFQFRIYASPPTTDKLVWTGDIVRRPSTESESERGGTSEPDLFLVLTPSCDLTHFWKKTRGVLTIARMTPIDERGSKKIWEYKNQNYGIQNTPSSITANNPMILPSVRLGDKSIDYALFAHELVFEHFPIPPNTSPNVPLTYGNLDGQFVRQDRISEPFLGGILDEIRRVLFRSGIPDFPDEEKNRIQGHFAQLKPRNK